MYDFLRNKYLEICPYGKKQLDYLVKSCIRDTMIVLVSAVCLVIFWNGMFRDNSFVYLSESIILVICLVFTEIPNYKLQEQENLIFRNLLLYFPRVKHHYLSCRHVANAVVRASEGMGAEMEQMAVEMYRLLMESNRKEKIREYIGNRDINRYWKLFLVQAYEASEQGDVCFAENMEHIRMELMEDIYRRKCREYAYTGYVFVTVAPFFMMPVLKLWGLEFAAELSFFYAGTGRLLETLVFLATILIYNMISEAKEIALLSGRRREPVWFPEILFQSRIINEIVRRLEGTRGAICKKIKKIVLQSGELLSYGRLCFRMFAWTVISFLVLAAFFSAGHTQERKNIVSSVENMQEIAPVVSEEKRDALEQYILEITEQCSRKNYVEEEMIRAMLRERIRLGNEFTENAVVEEIRKRIQQYQKAKGTIWEFMLCVFGGIALGSIPLLKLCFQTAVIRKEAEYEVKQFQSLVLMERKVHEMTVVGLLEDMEAFSICFKTVLRRCINTYGFGAKEALLQLKKDGVLIHSGFESLADAFLAVDEVGIEEAFAEIENDRRLLERMTRLEAEVNREKKKDEMELLVHVPMVLAVGVYFILPFFLYSMQSVSEVFNLLEEMQR